MSSSSSSSSSNNPFVAEENNDNDKNEQNKNKELEDTLKFLEEDSSNIAPPPAYEDIEKPPPTLPGYNHNGQPISNNLSLPPPRTPSTENYNRPNFLPPPTFSHFKRNGTGNFCCGSTRRQNCGCGWLVVLIIFVILTAISVVNNNVCSKLTLGDNPETFSFDPANINLLRIGVDTTRIRRGDVSVFNGQPNQQQVEIQVLTGTNGVTPKFSTSTQDGIYELDITQTSGFSIFNIPPRCMKMQVNVFLPSFFPTAPIPNAIQVKDLNIIMQGLTYQQDVTLTTETGSILLNGVIAQNVNLKSRDGNVILSNTTVNGIFNITTFDGNIQGEEIYLSNTLSAGSIDGDVILDLKIVQGANAKVEVMTNDGDVDINFENSFFGNYLIQSNDGAIRINGSTIDSNRVTGSVGGGSNLNIITNDGDINIVAL